MCTGASGLLTLFLTILSSVISSMTSNSLAAYNMYLAKADAGLHGPDLSPQQTGDGRARPMRRSSTSSASLVRRLTLSLHPSASGCFAIVWP